MVAVGEETGQIDQLLNDAADFYEGEVDYDLKKSHGKIRAYSYWHSRRYRISACARYLSPYVGYAQCG